MVRRDVAARKIANAAARLDAVERILDRPRETLLRDPEARDLTSFYLLLVQECVDLAAHWIVDESWLAPDDMASTFDVLAEHGTIPPPIAEGMRATVALRHRIAHGCTTLDHGQSRSLASPRSSHAGGEEEARLDLPLQSPIAT